MVRWFNRRAVACLVALILGAAWGRHVQAQQAAQSVGFVLEARGNWVCEGADPVRLRVGQALTGGARIRAVGPQASWRLVVALANGTTLARSCEPVDACREALALPTVASEQPGFWARARAAAAALFGHAPERFASTVARGGTGEDGVVLLDAGTLHLDGVLEGLAPGEYAGSLKHLPDGEGVPGDLRVSLPGPAGGTRVEVPGLPGGLYELKVHPERDAEAVSSVWILVVKAARYRQVSDAFEAARAATASWGADARPRAVRSFLRAYLEVLSEELSR